MIGVQKVSKSIRAYSFFGIIFTARSHERDLQSLVKMEELLDSQSYTGVHRLNKFVKSDSHIGDEIRRYQDVLQYTSSKVGLNKGEGVCMLSSSTVLLMGNRRGFYNKILVSKDGFKIGVNKLVNLVSVPKTSKTAPKESSKTIKGGV